MKFQLQKFLFLFILISGLTSSAGVTNEYLEDGAEYLIITYNEPGFAEKLTKLVHFRIAQGISTKLISTADIGGSSVDDIKNYITEAYTSWDTPPLAILLVGDHDKIPSPSFTGNQKQKTDISDNYYADMDGDDLPDITIARLPINDLFNLSNYIDRILIYETSPPDYSAYYDYPVTSMSWTDNSQIMFNAEVANGFLSSELNKEPLRENAIMLGTPGNLWYVSPETLNYFGPDGLNYVQATPEYLTDWSGDALGINSNLNNGAFLMVNLDHGTELGWSSPEYWMSDILGINSADPFFLISINNLNGKFNWSFDCFVEGLINHQFGPAGVIASTTNLNDDVASEYYFALIDALWDNFMPDINSANTWYPFVLPAFSNTIAKYQIAVAGIPNIESTLYGFHYFGEPFTPIYYNYPEALTVIHDETFEAEIQTFEITADIESIICLSANNEILSLGEGTGNPVTLTFDNLSCEDTLIVTVTKQNYIRYSEFVTCNNSTQIPKQNNNNSISLFPNPAKEFFQIQYKDNPGDHCSMLLYDHAGKLVRSDKDIDLPYQIIRKGLPSGIYFLHVHIDEKNIESFKVIFN